MMRVELNDWKIQNAPCNDEEHRSVIYAIWFQADVNAEQDSR